MRAILASLLLTAIAFAGCSGGGGSAGTAKDGLGAAQARADSWHDGADLIAVAGIETATMEDFDTSELPDEFQAALPGTDKDVGDGSVPAWMYAFHHEGHYYLVITSGSKVTFASENFSDEILEEFHESGTTEPIGSFDVDSDEAARIARDADQNYSAAAGGDTAFGFYALGSVDGRPVWTISVGSEDDDGEDEMFAFVQVAADDGEVLGVDIDDIVQSQLVPQQTGSLPGTATALEDETLEFAVEEGHDVIHFYAVAEGMTPFSTLTLTFQDAAGGEHELALSNGVSASVATVSNVLDVEAPATGAWTVTATLDEGVQQDFTLEFCTDGQPNSGNAPNMACA